MQYVVKSAALGVSIIALVSVTNSSNASAGITDALSNGKAYADLRLRYESVEQSNAVSDASALTLRSRLGYATDVIEGFSALLEAEDVRIVGGMDEYTVGPTGFNLGDYSVIADPETTEMDQGFIQYQSEFNTTKLGRQVITLDNHRFVGHVGWRQDRQTFDAFRTVFSVTENISAQYMYIGQRNFIFADQLDNDSKDHLLNISYSTNYGKLSAYSYLLELDNGTENALDTYGVRFTGATEINEMKLLYTAEYAAQDSERLASNFTTDYIFVETGLVVAGITAKLGYEVLGSDDGRFGFATPLATMHKFNGWADMFLMTPNQGLVDTTVSVSGKILGGKWGVFFHDFEADVASNSIDDLGEEIDVSFSKALGKNYYAGIKYASYKAGDIKVDTDKLWIWAGIKF